MAHIDKDEPLKGHYSPGNDRSKNLVKDIPVPTYEGIPLPDLRGGEFRQTEDGKWQFDSKGDETASRWWASRSEKEKGAFVKAYVEAETRRAQSPESKAYRAQIHERLSNQPYHQSAQIGGVTQPAMLSTFGDQLRNKGQIPLAEDGLPTMPKNWYPSGNPLQDKAERLAYLYQGRIAYSESKEYDKLSNDVQVSLSDARDKIKDLSQQASEDFLADTLSTATNREQFEQSLANTQYIRNPQFDKQAWSQFDKIQTDENRNQDKTNFTNFSRGLNATPNEGSLVPSIATKEEEEKSKVEYEPSTVFTKDPKTGEDLGVLTRNQRRAWELENKHPGAKDHFNPEPVVGDEPKTLEERSNAPINQQLQISNAQTVPNTSTPLLDSLQIGGRQWDQTISNIYDSPFGDPFGQGLKDRFDKSQQPIITKLTDNQDDKTSAWNEADFAGKAGHVSAVLSSIAQLESLFSDEEETTFRPQRRSSY